MTYSSAVLADSPYGFYPLDEASGSFADSSGNSRPMSTNGTIGYQSMAGPFAGSYGVAFGANTTSWATIGSAPSPILETWSGDAWVYLSSLPAAQANIFAGSDSPSGTTSSETYLAITTSGALKAGQFTAGGWKEVTSGTTLTTGQWYHVAAVMDDNNLKIFINGSNVGSISVGGTSGNWSRKLVLHTGYNRGAGAVVMSNVALYPTGLSDSRILAHYSAGVGISAGIATEASSALASTLNLAKPVGVALEVDAALSASTGRPVAHETSVALPASIRFGFTFLASPAQEIESALGGLAPEPIYLQLSSDGTLTIEDEDIGIGTPEFQITILDPVIERGPGVITFTVAGGLPEETIEFYLDGVLAWTTTLDSGGALSPSSLGIYAGSTANVGIHTLQGRQEMVTSGATLTADATYEVLFAPYVGPTNVGPDADPIAMPEAISHGTRHWILQDLFPTGSGGIGSYILPVNPSEMSNPHWENNFSSRRTLAKSGQYHVFQVGRSVPEWRFSGYAPTQEMVDKLLAYRGLNRRFYVIDHHNRAWTVVFTNVELKARLRHNYNGQISDWGHDYEVTALVLGQSPSIESMFSGAPPVPTPPPDPEVIETPEPPQDPPTSTSTLYGACPMKPGGESVSAALTVTTKWGAGAAVRQFKTNLSNPSTSASFGIVHTSYKPNIASVLNGSLDSTIRSIAMATPAGHVLEIWHEVDKKVRDGVDTRARLIAAKNRFYDQVKAVRPDVLVANTLTGWECSPTNSSTHGNIDGWAEVKADILGVDMDGIVPTSLPYTNYVDEINTAVDFVSRFPGYTHWAVPEFGCPRVASDSAGTARADWLTYYGNRFADNGALYVTLYEFDSTPNYSLTTDAELAAWNAFV